MRIPVTDSSAVALRAVRRHHDYLTIGVDAISINQADTREREVQVWRLQLLRSVIGLDNYLPSQVRRAGRPDISDVTELRHPERDRCIELAPKYLGTTHVTQQTQAPLEKFPLVRREET